MQFIVLASIFLGEVLIIYSEQLGARLYGLLSYSFATAFALSLFPAFVGAALLVTGYMLGLKYHQNIWAVTALSLGSILIVEPLFNYFYIGHLPDTSEFIGVALGILGIIAVVFF